VVSRIIHYCKKYLQDNAISSGDHPQQILTKLNSWLSQYTGVETAVITGKKRLPLLRHARAYIKEAPNLYGQNQTHHIFLSIFPQLGKLSVDHFISSDGYSNSVEKGQYFLFALHSPDFVLDSPKTTFKNQVNMTYPVDLGNGHVVNHDLETGVNLYPEFVTEKW
jgi:hypothetical protein